MFLSGNLPKTGQLRRWFAQPKKIRKAINTSRRPNIKLRKNEILKKKMSDALHFGKTLKAGYTFGNIVKDQYLHLVYPTCVKQQICEKLGSIGRQNTCTCSK